jgi:hypothetical protein
LSAGARRAAGEAVRSDSASLRACVSRPHGAKSGGRGLTSDMMETWMGVVHSKSRIMPSPPWWRP